MELNIGVVCDHAHVERSGKLCIIGIFDVINASSFPAHWPQLYLVLRFTQHPDELNRTHSAEILLGIEGQEKQQIFGVDFVTDEPMTPELPARTSIYLPITDVVFPREGIYGFDVFVDGRFEGSVPLYVRKV